MFKWFKKKKQLKNIPRDCYICGEFVDFTTIEESKRRHRRHHSACVKDVLCEPEKYTTEIIHFAVYIMKSREAHEKRKKALCIEAKTYCVED